MIQPIVAREKAVSGFFFSPWAPTACNCDICWKLQQRPRGADTGAAWLFHGSIDKTDIQEAGRLFWLQTSGRALQRKYLISTLWGQTTGSMKTPAIDFSLWPRLKEEKKERLVCAMRVSLPFPAGYLRCYGCRYCCLPCSSVSGWMCSRLAWGFPYEPCRKDGDEGSWIAPECTEWLLCLIIITALNFVLQVLEEERSYLFWPGRIQREWTETKMGGAQTEIGRTKMRSAQGGSRSRGTYCNQWP